MKFTLMITTIFFLGNYLLQAQCANYREVSSPTKPAWMGGDIPKGNANSYFQKVSAQGYQSLAEARSKAMDQIRESRSLTRQTIIFEGDNSNKNIKSSNTLELTARVEDEYWEQCSDGTYYVYLLCQIAKNPYNPLVDVNVTDNYNVGMRAFIPSYAQFYKGHNVKAAIILSTEIPLITLGIVGFIVGSQNYNNAIATNNLVDRQRYNDNYQTWNNVGMYSLIGAAAIYVWNIIDAYATKPKIRRCQIAMAPSFNSQTNSYGLQMCYKF